MNIKFIPHNKPTLGIEEIKAINEAIQNSELTIGSKVEDFENLFSEHIGVNSVASSSGTAALHLALIALGVKENDEVILPSYTCVAVGLPVLYQRAKPILTDIDEDYNISPEDVERKITTKTRAIIIPHMFGYPADLDGIKELCKQNDIYVIEDCAQSVGAKYHGKNVGGEGDISIFSFYATKIMTTIQGGMVCTKNSDWIQTVKDLRYHDQVRSSEDNDPRIKFSYMMSDISAAMGIVQLQKLDHFIKRRREIASLYREELDETIKTPVEMDKKKHVYSRFVVRTSAKPEEIITELRKSNIICEMMHNPPLHKRELFKKFNFKQKFLKTEEIIDSAISLPIYPSLSDEEVLRVTDTFNKTLRSFY